MNQKTYMGTLLLAIITAVLVVTVLLSRHVNLDCYPTAQVELMSYNNLNLSETCKKTLMPAIKGLSYLIDIISLDTLNPIVDLPTKVVTLALPAIKLYSQHNIHSLSNSTQCIPSNNQTFITTVHITNTLTDIYKSDMYTLLSNISSVLNHNVPSIDISVLDALAILSGHTLNLSIELSTHIIYQYINVTQLYEDINYAFNNLENLFLDLIQINVTTFN